MALVDLTGKRFGRWTVKRLCEDSGKVKFWWCVCDCGTERRVFGGDLKRGGSESCGCLMREKAAQRSSSHKMSKHPAYRNWIHAKTRCEDPASNSYEGYGSRGIRICERWASFSAFWKDMGSTWKPGLTLDRIDVNGNYEPTNCRWATAKEQANNRRDNRIIDTPEGPMNVTQAGKRFGINPVTINSRLLAGWPANRLLDPPRYNIRWNEQT